jgi:indole-3-glycerol phosphate synthase
MTTLEQIVANKRKELPVKMEKTPVGVLERMPGFERKTVSLTQALLNPERTGIIAEFKRKSPSKGILNAYATIEEVTTGYFRAGASALSVLTDMEFFGGSAEDLIRTREINPIPILRKDFIIHEYQVVESKAMGADAVLLIAALLDKRLAKQLAALARSLHLQVILEVHNAAEIAMANEHVSVIGVNNRDLRDFSVDINRSMELAPLIAPDFLKISESGIYSVTALKQLKSFGYDGFLIGERFMKEADPATAFAEFVKLIIQNP